MTYEVTVDIKLKDGMLDPEGDTIKRSLNLLGYNEVNEAMVGKKIYLEIEGGSRDEVIENVDEMCQRLLANPVIHNYEIRVD
ncbi:phosphoribosylformylglycinamidine synthase subunit PurS [Methanonatronarchaeum sp. AMET-Sl]|uniref:phosphoribosylformylglycinamidine synthase subunit PurS n=1 Tax=Methanonatronarchaeum sp. AMET-Sl TaxID=3037654 RepID=UPI00244DE0E9|nr:phosphoribosylformylglycinamidine synthase subunit PurS [Methanonatronarchaeum sp. AMET-Sl]WGI18150.1 phosphoribosylformylglycinamidine synthase subunit PurS [Methanonatronarchaeum sp. AMET-Sl]